MEHGSQDSSASTFCLADEDHTLANSLRFILNQDPRVTVCGYSIPHPSEARVNIRVQTTGDPANEVLKDSCQDLMLMCQHVRGTFNQAVADFKTRKASEAAEAAAAAAAEAAAAAAAEAEAAAAEAADASDTSDSE